MTPFYTHGKALTTAVLLLNLGTPEAPTPTAVRTYLREFLSDPRVVELPKILWWPILHGIILPFRASRSAKKYASIWQKDGSPLKIHTQAQTKALASLFADKNIDVVYAMRYGSPNIAQVLAQLQAKNLHQLLILPLYPQYSATTTASCMDEIMRVMQTWRAQPSIRTIHRYHDHADYIAAIAQSIEQYWQQHTRPSFDKGDVLLFSFHGIPQRSLDLGDFYHCECYKTARLVAHYLGLDRSHYQVSFQSRLGRAKWLTPYTDETLKKLAKQAARVDVVCPGFASDCLETLEEINLEGREEFITHGGKVFNYIPCLNASDLGVDMLEKIILQHLEGWKIGADDAGQHADYLTLKQASHRYTHQK